MEPMMVATKIAKSCQDFVVIPSGTGKARTMRPAVRTTAHFASFHDLGVEACDSDEVCNGFSSGCDKCLTVKRSYRVTGRIGRRDTIMLQSLTQDFCISGEELLRPSTKSSNLTSPGRYRSRY